MWQSILKNYSYAWNGGRCSSDKHSYLKVDNPLSTFLIRNIKQRQRPDPPIQFLNPVNGSFRFVVCGIKGSENVLYAELISVYDKLTWFSFVLCLTCAAYIWKFLLSVDGTSSSCTVNRLAGKMFLGRLYSLMKVVLEQGDISPASSSISSQKIRLFLGVFLAMCIILSNGYKNTNVYTMVTPRKPVRYQRFEELVHDNFSIYTISHVDIWSKRELANFNWFSQSISREPGWTHNSLNTFIGEQYLFFRKSIILDNLYEYNSRIRDSPYVATKQEVKFNIMVQRETHIHPQNILGNWIKGFKEKHVNWKNLTDDLDTRYDLLDRFVRFQFGNIERQILLPLLSGCNKTALVLYSNEAETYARLLTPSRGNVGKEVYSQNYFLIRIQGFVTPPLLTRIGRIKESAILEHWTNVSEFISLVQLQNSVTSTRLLQEDHPAGASLKGHIVVIFAVLLFGLGLSSVGLVLEILVVLLTCFRRFV